MDNKCLSCGGTLVFDADLQMMVCEHCLEMFPVPDSQTEKQTVFQEETLAQSISATETDYLQHSYTQELMDVQVYDCKNCGAQLAISDVEVATYCAYCGQPTIVFRRMEKRKRPQYIIPFKIDKNQAISNIREKLLKSDYVSDEIKHFKPELLRGIYVPYGMFCYEIRDKQILHAKKVNMMSHNNDTKDIPFRYYFREATAHIGHIPVDASYQLSNESADRLEPYFGRDLVPFDPAYLSGYYADLRDEDFTLLKSRADGRAMEMFQEKMLALPYLTSSKTVKSDPHMTCIKEEYALLPVWFLVFEDDGEKYTIMVNGQTGKVVGAVPTSLRTFLKWLLITFFFIALFAIPAALIGSFTGYFPYVAGVILLGTPALIVRGVQNMKRLNRSLQLTTAKSIRSFATERQDI